MSFELEKKFEYFLNNYFRGKRYENYTLDYYYDIPQNISIHLMQQVKRGLTKENVIPFITWIEIERNKTGIEGWKILFEDVGEILTDFGYVSFEACDIQRNVIIRISQNPSY
jgi:hypothetical protein